MNSDNPHVIPGQYDPQRQAKTEVGDYLSAIYPGYFDPTQVAMRPGDTYVPMQVEKSRGAGGQGGKGDELELIQQEYKQKVEQQYQQQHKLLSNHAIAPPVESFSSSQIQAIKIPIVIELTINLNIKHNG